MILNDIEAEKAVLAGLCKYGDKVYLDIASLINEDSFSSTINAVIYKCIGHLLKNNDLPSVDMSSIISAGQEVGVSHILSKGTTQSALADILSLPINKESITRFAVKLKKIKIIKDLNKKFEDCKQDLVGFNGSESISEIISVAENVVLDFVNNLDEEDTKPKAIAEGLREKMEDRCDNPITQLGIPTGFPVWDKAIGGLRPGVHLIGARTKVGKSTICANMGLNMAMQGVPVLYLDTEMSQEEQTDRLLASMTEIVTNRISTGQVGNLKFEKTRLFEAIDKLDRIPHFKHKNVVGMSLENQMALVRRWLKNDVGLLPDGTAKECVIIYDYLKLMDSSELQSSHLQEYQLLGFMMNSFHNLCVRFRVPILSAIQLNRDGINKDSTDVVSGSDRIVWACSSLSLLKTKSDEEIKTDGPNNGNRKLIPLVARHGGCLDDKEYINCFMKGWCSKITEGKTNLELNDNSGGDLDGNFTIEDDGKDIDFDSP
jgi:replicative DNA helicase